MCWDTLYGLDADFVPRPQLCEGHVVEPDGLRWTFTLREGIRFHDSEPVRAEDAVASIRRWMPRDSLGQSLAERLDDIAALDDRRFAIRLKRPFGPMRAALGKPSSYPCFVFPRRFAEVDPARPFTEVVGSGRYRFVDEERLSGARAVYHRFEGYRPAPAAPSLLGGAKLAHFERVEFRIMPDAGTAAAALQAGESDWWEQIAANLRPVLRRQCEIVMQRVDFGGLNAMLRFNHLHPPFDDPAIRRALPPIVDQSDFMQAVAGSDRALWQDGVGAFPRSSPLANDEGLAAVTGPRSADRARAALAAAGYGGQKVTVLHPTDVAKNNAMTTVLTDTLKRAGLDAESATSDWGTVLQRRARREPSGQGGWNALVVVFGGIDLVNPGQHPLLRANGLNGWFGWPASTALEALREAWIEVPDLAAQQAFARQIQAQSWVDLPFIPLGQFFTDSAWRRGISGVQRGMTLPINVRRG